ncbi:hypothetical protein pb186bvf_013809 [Paramecium bursaria]
MCFLKLKKYFHYRIALTMYHIIYKKKEDYMFNDSIPQDIFQFNNNQKNQYLDKQSYVRYNIELTQELDIIYNVSSNISYSKQKNLFTYINQQKPNKNTFQYIKNKKKIKKWGLVQRERRARILKIKITQKHQNQNSNNNLSLCLKNMKVIYYEDQKDKSLQIKNKVEQLEIIHYLTLHQERVIYFKIKNKKLFILGAYGEVRKAIHKQTNQMRAVKIIHKSATNKEDQERLLNEDHPNIIKIFEFYQDDRYFYIVTELCTGGELFEKIHEEGSFSEKKAAEIMKQQKLFIGYIQYNGRDLKPENLIYESEKENSLLKVIDFGTSKEFDPTQKLKNMMKNVIYGLVESFFMSYYVGIDFLIIFFLTNSYPPFPGKTDERIMEKVAKGQYNFDTHEWDEISKEAKDFIKKMLTYDPAKRYTASQCLVDPWMKKWTNAQEYQQICETLEYFLLQNFIKQAEQKLQEATFRYIVNYLATKEEKAELLKTFQALDTNQDGKLSKEELLTGYIKIMNPNEAQEEVERIFQMVDKNQSGSIDYTEFVIATIDRQQLLSKQRLEITFRMFDKVYKQYFQFPNRIELKDIFGGISEDVWKQIKIKMDKFHQKNFVR